MFRVICQTQRIKEGAKRYRKERSVLLNVRVRTKPIREYRNFQPAMLPAFDCKATEDQLRRRTPARE